MHKNKFISSIMVVASGTAGAQAISMLASPIIARLYGPEAIGILSTFLAVQAILNPLATMSYHMAIVLPKRDVVAFTVVKISIVISILISIVLCLLLTIFSETILLLFKEQDFDLLIYFLPLAVLASALLSITSHIIIRYKLFVLKSKSVIKHAVITNIVKVILGATIPSATALVSTAVIGNIAHVFLLKDGIKYNIKNQFKLANIRYKAKKYIVVTRRYNDFCIFRTPQIILNAISVSMPVIMLASFGGAAAAGFYALGRTILGIPITLIGESVSVVFYPRMNEAFLNGENCFKLLIKATGVLILVGIIPFGVIMLYGPILFSLVFGEEWTQAGIYGQWLSLWLYFSFINRAVIATIPIFKMQAFFLKYEFYTLIFKIIALLIGFVVLDDALKAVSIYSIFSVITSCYLTYEVIKKVKC